MTTPEYGLLADPLSDDPLTDRERDLLLSGGVELYVPGWVLREILRALRAGHAAGRASVIDAPARVYRVGDPPPERKITVFDDDGRVTEWDCRGHDSWPDYLRCYGPLVEIDVDYAAALAADELRRVESPRHSPARSEPPS